MRDIKELIYAAVEENAVQFQELVNAQLQVRAYDAIESLRPEIGASMFGEEVEVDEAVRIRDRAYSSIERGHGDDKKTFQGQMDRKHIAAGALARRKRTGPGVKGFNSAMRPAKASDGYQPRETGSVRAKNEEVELDEVAMPQNQADWQALITHQIKTAGHPVATDAQFRAPHGKDTSKIASQEPPEDKMNYAAAQGGTVKQ